MTTQRFTIEELTRFCRQTFEHFEVPPEDAALAAEVLAVADIRGIDTHGVQRLHTYFDMLELGRINPTPELSVVRETACTATVDGDNGLGLVVGPKANRVAQDKCRDAGAGFVSVCNTNHFGSCAFYVLETIAGGDMISWAGCNSTKLVAPLWGAERMLGTNPIAMAFPAGDEPAVVVDMATSAAAYGKIEIARRKAEKMPTGWAIDRDGKDTDEPNAMVDGGAMLPLGSWREMGGHKGYCLAVAVDIFSCVLSGANWGPWAPPFALRQEVPGKRVGKGIGHWFGAWRIDGFIDVAEFHAQMDDYVRTFRKTRPQPGTDGPLIPGDPEREAEADRRKNGVPVIESIVNDLKDIADRTGIEMPATV